MRKVFIDLYVGLLNSVINVLIVYKIFPNGREYVTVGSEKYRLKGRPVSPSRLYYQVVL